MKNMAGFVVLALMSGCGLSGCGGAAPDQAQHTEPTARVRTALSESRSIAHDVQVAGAVEAGPGSAHAIVAPAEAIVTAIEAPNGTSVKAGQVIAVLRPSPAGQTELARAGIDLATTTAAYQRAVRLRSDGLVSDADVETARSAQSTASAVRRNLRLAGGGGVLRAPLRGTVQGLTARPGDQIAAGATLATIGASVDLRARFGADPALARQIHQGQPIRISAGSGGADVTATVAGVDPQVDPATRQASVFVRLPARVQWGIGEPLRAKIELGTARAGISIPYAALLDDGGKSFVFVVQHGVAKKVEVQPGNSSGDRIQILDGLAAGEKLVVEGGTALEDGMKVTEAGAAR